VCQQGTRLTNDILKLKITTKKIALESVRQIIRQKPAKASGVRQPKKVDRKMIGMGAKSITVVRVEVSLLTTTRCHTCSGLQVSPNTMSHLTMPSLPHTYELWIPKDLKGSSTGLITVLSDDLPHWTGENLDTQLGSPCFNWGLSRAVPDHKHTPTCLVPVRRIHYETHLN
jgi:hypothetical protein